MTTPRLEGLIAATYTPLDEKGELNTKSVEPMVEHLIHSGVGGLYVCGSTGEGMSLSSDERKLIAEAFVKSVDGRVPVILQVGHNSLAEARALAAHANEIGADIVSATCPSYFKVTDVDTLVECMSLIAAAAADLPFYYYHIPTLTGSSLDMVEFLRRAGDRIPNLTGLKYTDMKLHEFQCCIDTDNNRFDVVWGLDEMLLGALVTGTKAAIGSTYNIAAPLYRQLINAFEMGNLGEARRLQLLSIEMIDVLCRFPFHAAVKRVLEMSGLAMGGCRLPQGNLNDDQTAQLKNDLNAIGYFEWSRGDRC